MKEGEREMELNNHIPLTVYFEVGKTTKMIEDLLTVTKGTVYRLDDSEAKVISIVLENKKIGKGKMLTKDGKIYVEIIDLIFENEEDM